MIEVDHLSKSYGSRRALDAISPDPASFAHAVAEAGYVARPERDGFLIADAEPLEIGRIAYAAGAGLSHLERVTRSLEDTYFEILTATDEGVRA